MRRRTGPITPGYVRRISPTAVSVMPFTGSSVDDMEQLRWLAKQYAKQVPFGLDWPMNFWADRIAFDAGDHAARCWLDGYFQRHTDPAVHAGNATRH